MLLHGILDISLVIQAVEAVEILHVEQSWEEVLQVALILGSPLNLRKGGKSWQQLPLHLLGILYPLGPDTPLGTDDVLLLGRSQLIRARIEIIYPLDGTTILDYLLGLLLIWIVVNIIGYAITGPVGCGISIVSFVIMVVVSVCLTHYNDNSLLESLRQQKQENTVDYNSILYNLNNNTAKFYEAK